MFHFEMCYQDQIPCVYLTWSEMQYNINTVYFHKKLVKQSCRVSYLAFPAGEQLRF